MLFEVWEYQISRSIDFRWQWLIWSRPLTKQILMTSKAQHLMLNSNGNMSKVNIFNEQRSIRMFFLSLGIDCSPKIYRKSEQDLFDILLTKTPHSSTSMHALSNPDFEWDHLFDFTLSNHVRCCFIETVKWERTVPFFFLCFYQIMSSCALIFVFLLGRIWCWSFFLLLCWSSNIEEKSLAEQESEYETKKKKYKVLRFQVSTIILKSTNIRNDVSRSHIDRLDQLDSSERLTVKSLDKKKKD